jgi:hypothetical protein
MQTQNTVNQCAAQLLNYQMTYQTNKMKYDGDSKVYKFCIMIMVNGLHLYTQVIVEFWGLWPDFQLFLALLLHVQHNF